MGGSCWVYEVDGYMSLMLLVSDGYMSFMLRVSDVPDGYMSLMLRVSAAEADLLDEDVPTLPKDCVRIRPPDDKRTFSRRGCA